MSKLINNAGIGKKGIRGTLLAAIVLVFGYIIPAIEANFSFFHRIGLDMELFIKICSIAYEFIMPIFLLVAVWYFFRYRKIQLDQVAFNEELRNMVEANQTSTRELIEASLVSTKELTEATEAATREMIQASHIAIRELVIRMLAHQYKAHNYNSSHVKNILGRNASKGAMFMTPYESVFQIKPSEDSKKLLDTDPKFRKLVNEVIEDMDPNRQQ